MENLLKRLQEIKTHVLQLKTENSERANIISKKDKELSRLRQLIDIQNSTIKQLEQKLKIKRIADGVSEDAGSEESSNNRDLKFKINEMIREVDKIISLIHR